MSSSVVFQITETSLTEGWTHEALHSLVTRMCCCQLQIVSLVFLPARRLACKSESSNGAKSVSRLAVRRWLALKLWHPLFPTGGPCGISILEGLICNEQLEGSQSSECSINLACWRADTVQRCHPCFLNIIRPPHDYHHKNPCA